jgi:hypothetical protein
MKRASETIAKVAPVRFLGADDMASSSSDSFLVTANYLLT